MNPLETIEKTPPPVRYSSVPSTQEGWFHFRAVHEISGLPISCRTWAKLVSQCTELGMELSKLLRDLELEEGMLFECRGAAKDGSMNVFEFAVGPAPSLKTTTHADPEPFSKHLFAESEEDNDQDFGDVQWAGVSQDEQESDDDSESASDDSSSSSQDVSKDIPTGCAFESLGGDALLVAPRPTSRAVATDCRFAHLANYVRLSSLEEAGKLWSLVATEYEKAMAAHADTERLVYLSTNGLGVSFLSFRVEHAAKYYNYQAFACAASAPSNATPLRIQIASDLHTEFYGLLATQAPQHLIVPNAPVLALLGDIGIAFTESLRAFLHMQADQFEKVLFIAGNHEFYNVKQCERSVSEQWEWLKSVCAERDNIHLLEKESMEFHGVRILGTTLWSDIPDDMLRDAEMALNDYNLCYNHAKGKNVRPLMADDTSKWYHENLEWLCDQINRARQEGIPTVVLTHHTPQKEGTSHPRFDGNPLNCCFSSDLTQLLSFPVKFWACGHTHYNFDLDIGGETRLVSNQRGYKGDSNRDYQRDGLILEICAML